MVRVSFHKTLGLSIENKGWGIIFYLFKVETSKKNKSCLHKLVLKMTIVQFNFLSRDCLKDYNFG